MYRLIPGILGDESLVVPTGPSADTEDLRSPKLDGPPRLDGPNGGEGLNGVTGEDGKRLVAPAPIGDGSAGARDDVGELCAGLEGREGPPMERGECVRSDGEGE